MTNETRPVLLVRCHLPKGAQLNTFTDGQRYVARPLETSRSLYVVHDNLGHERYIFPDGTPCGHLIAAGKRRPGHWETIGEVDA